MHAYIANKIFGVKMDVSTYSRARDLSMRHVLVFAALAVHSAAFAAVVRDDAAFLRLQSQAFSDASASGDGIALAKLLDDHVTFMLENGDIVSKKDVTGDAPSPPSATAQPNHLQQKDFAVQFYGDVAVTSFTDQSTVVFKGQTLVSDFRSTEVWRKSRGRWLMISSQTVAVQKDPPAITLPAATLDGYVGRYSLASDYVVEIKRQGTELTGSVNGGEAFSMKAEASDVFFTPGQIRLRRVFQRGADGKVTGFVSRRDGHDLVLQRVG